MSERAVNKNAEAMVVCLAPDVCKTPCGSAMVPVPYTITCKFDVATNTADNVRYNGDPAFTMASRLPKVQGDEPGTGGGILSGVNRGTCRPIVSSSTVKANGQFIVRHNDLMQMNCNGDNGPANTVGRIVYIGVGSGPAAGETVSKEERVTTDQDGKTTVEKREVTRDPKTGALTETRQRTTIDPRTGDIHTQQASITDNLDGTSTMTVSEGTFNPSQNNYTFREASATGPAANFGPSGNSGPVLGTNQIGKVQPDGRTYLGDGMYARTGSPSSPGPTPPPSSPGGTGGTPPTDSGGLDDVFPEDDPEYEAALREQDALEAEMGILNEEMAWQAAETAADVAGLFDPTPASDTVAAGLALRRGDYLGAGLSLLSWIPYAGDAIAKPIKGTRAARKAAKLTQKLTKLKAKLDKVKDGLSRLAKKKGIKKAEGEAAEGVAKGVDGGHIPKKPKKLREEYLGKTPSKSSKTGREVIDRMKKEGKIREGADGLEFKASDGEWYPLKDADMAHQTDAVTWWNEVGRQYGPRSPEVRNWMLDSNNYYLEHYSINRSLGAKLGQTYLPPIKH